jgi:putative transposase
LLLVADVGPADERDVDGGWAVLEEATEAELLGRAGCLWVDGMYRGEFEQEVVTTFGIVVEVTTRTAGQRGFTVQAKRWAVERAFGWLNRARRLAKDFEECVESSATWIYLTFCRLLLHRLASTL